VAQQTGSEAPPKEVIEGFWMGLNADGLIVEL